MYKCLNCGKTIELEEVAKKIRCPYCGYRILLKKNPQTQLKTVKAR